MIDAVVFISRLRIDVHDDDDDDDDDNDNDNDNAWQRGPLWPHGIGPKTPSSEETVAVKSPWSQSWKKSVAGKIHGRAEKVRFEPVMKAWVTDGDREDENQQTQRLDVERSEWGWPNKAEAGSRDIVKHNESNKQLFVEKMMCVDE